VIREKAWPLERRDAFALRMRALAGRYGATLLLNGRAEDARRLGMAGVHWTAEALRMADSLPPGLRVAASCHTEAELERAADLGVDFAVLGPVYPTPTHPDAKPLTFERFAALVAGARLPVFALGGLTGANLDQAVAHGAHGVALRRAAWPSA
jgi:8-oxo-dGTP diphosphatase